MKTSKYIPGLVLIFSFIVSSQSQNLTLEEVKENIMQAHPTLRMYDAEAQSMDAAARGARSWMPPEASTGFFMMPYNPRLMRETDEGEGMGQYSIAIQQMIPNKRRQSAEYDYMSSMSSVLKERKQAVLNDLLAEAKKNYFEWVVIKKKVIIVQRNEKLLDFMIRNAEIRYKNGLGKLGAYYKAKAALGTLQNMRLMFENEIALRRINLNTLMNRDKATYFDVDTVYTAKDYAIIPLDSTTFLHARSDLRAIEEDIHLVGLQQQLERAKLKPEFGFRFEHMIGLGGQPAQYTAMAMVRMPFVSWAGKMNKSTIESLEWRRESLRYERKMIINELSGMASAMLTELTTLRRQIKLYEENIIPALLNNYNTMHLAYEQNTEELFELFDAWESVNMAQLEYLDQIQKLLDTQVELERILEIK